VFLGHIPSACLSVLAIRIKYVKCISVSVLLAGSSGIRKDPMSEGNSKDLKSGDWNLSGSLSEQLEVTSRISALLSFSSACMHALL